MSNKLPYQHRTSFHVKSFLPPTTRNCFELLHGDTRIIKNKIYQDDCVLYLPLSYTPDQTPTKLIIYCKHGSSLISCEEDIILQEKVMVLALKEGYAILGVNGIPTSWREDLKICERLVGNPLSISSYKRAYDYVLDHYNIYNEAFVYGFSQGGMGALNVANLSGIPVKAAILNSPALSMRFHQWDLIAPCIIDNVTYLKSARLNIARIFNFPTLSTNESLESLTYDENLLKGYDCYSYHTDSPYVEYVQKNNLWCLPEGKSINQIKSKTYLSYPVKIWCGTKDSAVGIDVMKVFIQSIKNAGGKGEIRIFQGGTHGLNNIPNQKEYTYTFINDRGFKEEVKFKIKTSDIEMLLFLAEYGGNFSDGFNL